MKPELSPIEKLALAAARHYGLTKVRKKHWTARRDPFADATVQALLRKGKLIYARRDRVIAA